jgi:diadenosine tetraphosphate (Ap4A) HIT family hydrolase
VHKEKFSELTKNDFYSMQTLVNWATKRLKITGGGLMLRFGDSEYSGATVHHLHFHFIEPQKSSTVIFPIG